jgi:hypothetical protein
MPRLARVAGDVLSIDLQYPMEWNPFHMAIADTCSLQRIVEQMDVPIKKVRIHFAAVVDVDLNEERAASRRLAR